MSFDAFVKIDGIEGESTDSKHAGWIEAINYSAGASQTVSTTASSAGGATGERADIKPFTFTRSGFKIFNQVQGQGGLRRPTAGIL